MSFGNTVTFRKPVGIAPRYPVKMVPNKCGCLTHVLEGETQRMFRKLWPIHSNRLISQLEVLKQVVEEYWQDDRQHHHTEG